MLATATVLAIYLSVLAVMPKHVFCSPDEGGRFFELRSVEWRDGLTRTIPYPGRDFDPSYQFFPTSRIYPRLRPDGSIQLPWPAWFPLLSQIPLAAFGMTGIYLVPLFSGLLVALLAGVLAYEHSPRLAPLAVLVVGLASPVFFYSLAFWEHTLATLLAMLGVVVVVVGGRRPSSLLAAIPIALLACMLRLEMVAFVVALAAAVVLSNLRAPASSVTVSRTSPSWRFSRPGLRLTGLALIFGLGVTFVLAIPSYRAGMLWWGLPSRREGLSFFARVPRGLLQIFINTELNGGPLIDRQWELLALGAVAATVLAAFVRRSRVEASLIFPALVVILSLSAWLAWTPPLHRSLHGLVPIAPYVVIAAYAVPHAWRQRQRPLLFLSLITTLYLVCGIAAVMVFYLAPWGLETTLEWGPRYLLTAYPLLAILTVLAARTYWRSTRPAAQRVAFVTLLAVLTGISALQQARGLQMVYDNRQTAAGWDRVLRKHGPIVTNVWWLPSAVAELATSRELFFVYDRAAYEEWLAEARRRQLREFTFASMGPLKMKSRQTRLLGATRRQLLYVSRLRLRPLTNDRGQPNP